MEGFLRIVYWLIILYVVLSLIVLGMVLAYKQFVLHRAKRQKKEQKKWQHLFEQDEPVLTEKEVEQLKNAEELLHFTNALQTYNKTPEREKKLQAFIYSHVPVWVELGDYYAKQSLIVRAYFAWSCQEADIRQPEDDSEMIQMMQRYVRYPSIYCRNNALGALYTFGNVKGVVDAYRLLSEEKVPYPARLAADGLSQFTGDKQALADALLEHFNDFSRDYQVGVIDFFQKEGGHLKHELIKLLEDPSLNIDLVCALMRYYKQHPVQEYKPVLLSWMSWKYRYQWEIIAVTASTLAHYPGEDTVRVLRKCLEADNWFIRKNAGISLEQLEETAPQLEAVLSEERPETIDQLTYDLASKELV